MTLRDLTDIVAFIDPASGKAVQHKRTSSRSADVVVGQDAISRIFVLHAWADRVSTTTHTDRIFKLVQDFPGLRVVGIDASAMQSLYADALQREAKQRLLRLPLLPMKMPTNVDKVSRTETILQPVINSGRLVMHPTHRDLWLELEAFPAGATLDLADALAQAISMLRKTTVAKSGAMERDARLEFLRESNAPSWYIDEVARSA